jgi:hypothetical protein
MITRRARRSLKDDLELVTYTVSSGNGTHEIEDLVKPGGPYLSLGEMVDMETMIHTFADKKPTDPHASPRCPTVRRILNR